MHQLRGLPAIKLGHRHPGRRQRWILRHAVDGFHSLAVEELHKVVEDGLVAAHGDLHQEEGLNGLLGGQQQLVAVLLELAAELLHGVVGKGGEVVEIGLGEEEVEVLLVHMAVNQPQLRVLPGDGEKVLEGVHDHLVEVVLGDAVLELQAVGEHEDVAGIAAVDGGCHGVVEEDGGVLHEFRALQACVGQHQGEEGLLLHGNLLLTGNQMAQHALHNAIARSAACGGNHQRATNPALELTAHGTVGLHA